MGNERETKRRYHAESPACHETALCERATGTAHDARHEWGRENEGENEETGRKRRGGEERRRERVVLSWNENAQKAK